MSSLRHPLLSLLLLAQFVILSHGCKKIDDVLNGSSTNSVTDASFTGRKFFFGFGEGATAGSAWSPHAAEIRFDLANVRDLFTSVDGGAYTADVLVADDQNQANAIVERLSAMRQQVSSADMYVQYSGSHGTDQLNTPSSGGSTATDSNADNSPSAEGTSPPVGGLPAFSLDFNRMAEMILAIPAKEVIIFTMSCYSGGLIDALNARQSEWRNRLQDEGRTLFIMSSSNATQVSLGSPRSPDPTGNVPILDSRGSAYGNVLKTALAGDADANGDGMITLAELTQYMTNHLADRQTPVVTGSYDPNLSLVRVNSRRAAASVAGALGGASGIGVGAVAAAAGAAAAPTLGPGGAPVNATTLASLNAYNQALRRVLGLQEQVRVLSGRRNQTWQSILTHAFEEINGATNALEADLETARDDEQSLVERCNQTLQANVTSASSNGPSASNPAVDQPSLPPGCAQADFDAAATRVSAAQEAFRTAAMAVIQNYTNAADARQLSDCETQLAQLEPQLRARETDLTGRYRNFLATLDSALNITPLPAPNPSAENQVGPEGAAPG